MSSVTFSKAGVKSTVAVKLPKSVFGVEVNNHELIKEAYVGYLANSRQNLAVTKKRGEVRGGGKKPWRQKGTGRARFGSSRNPIWRGGGIAFGPTGNETYTRSLSTNSRRQALAQALTIKENAGSIMTIEAFESKDGKVNSSVKLLDKVGAKGSVLIVIAEKDSMILRATKNLPKVMISTVARLNVYDVMNADCIIITTPSISLIESRLNSSRGASK